MEQYFLNKEDVLTHTSNSHEKVPMKCPDCGNVEMKIIKNVKTQGYSCPICGDGISYPNKYIRRLFTQLPVDNYEFEFSPQWANNKRYDIFFNYNNSNYLVEVDGGLHKRETFDGCLEYNIKNDYHKNLLAKNNGFKMIRIDADVSDSNYIKEKVLESELNELFDLSKINWDECEKAALSNLAKEVCAYYMAHRFDCSIADMIKQFCISNSTFRRYIKAGTKFGWISETKEESSLVRSLNTINKTYVNVDLYDKDNIYIRSFNSILACSKYIKYMYSEIISPYKQYNKPI